MKMTKIKTILVLLVIMLAAVVYLAISISSKGAYLMELQEQKLSLIEDNRKLSNDLYERTSLKSVRNKASDLGLQENQEIVYINPDQPVAKLQ